MLKSTKGIIQEVRPFPTHGDYMVYEGWELSKLSPISVLNTTPKSIIILALMFVKHTYFCALRLVLKTYLKVYLGNLSFPACFIYKAITLF